MQLRILAGILGCIAAVTGTAGIVQAVTHNDVRHEVAIAQQRAHFWRVIAREEEPNTPTVDNRLAKDLRDRISPGSSSLPPDITEFRGTSNAYGGISDAIGYDPFENESLACRECGPLDARTKRNLLLIQEGQVEQVVANDVPQLDTSYTLTPNGMSVLAWGALLWAVGGPLSLFAAHRRAMAIPAYGIRQFGDLSWALSDYNNGTRLAIMLSAPTFFLPYLSWRGITARRFERKMQEQYGSEMATVREIDRTLGLVSLRHGDDVRVRTLQADRDALVEEIQSRTRASEQGSLGYLLSNTEKRLHDVQDALTTRSESLAELNEPEEQTRP